MTTDPFATQEKIPSVSFKDAPIGTRVTGKVVEAPTTVEARDFDTGEIARWPDGNTKKTVVTGLEINGERLNLWAPKPSAMFRAIQNAQEKAGAQIAVGGTLTIIFTGEQPNPDKPRLNPQKLYDAIYIPNDPFAGAPDWAQPNPQTGEVPMQQPQARQPAQQPQSAYAQTAPQQSAPQSSAPTFDAATIEAIKAAGMDPAAVIAAALAKQQG